MEATTVIPYIFVLMVGYVGGLITTAIWSEQKHKKKVHILYDQSLKVHNAKICIDCDEIHNKSYCPKCDSPYFFVLAESEIKPLTTGWDNSLQDAIRRKKDGTTHDRNIQAKVPNKKADSIRDAAFASINAKLGKRKRTAISCAQNISEPDCLTA